MGFVSGFSVGRSQRGGFLGSPVARAGRRTAAVRRNAVSTIRALVFTHKDVTEECSNMVISGEDCRGHLLSISKVIDELGITVEKGFISTLNDKVNNSFTVSKEGRKLTPEEISELREKVELITSAEPPPSELETKRDVPDHSRTPNVNHDYNSGAYVLVDNQRSQEFTSVTISGPNRAEIFSKLLEVISSYGCNIIFGLLSTFDYDTTRRHDVLHVVASDGRPVDEPTRIALSNTLTNVLRDLT
mmetsp:Transcript_21898/g.89086  ORF Transcript_21898/g.89086 Transcript_21898/m.89086 type:complete len:245 (-) Transcript_21898:873-1607(-)